MAKTVVTLEGEYRDSGLRTPDGQVLYWFFRTGVRAPRKTLYLKTTKREVARAAKRGVGVGLWRGYGPIADLV